MLTMEISTLFIILLTFQVQRAWTDNPGLLSIVKDYSPVVIRVPIDIKGYEKGCTPYYSNCTACYNIQLLSCGNVKSNPGPDNESESSSTETRLSTHRCLSGISFNARSIRHKCIDLLTFIECTRPDIICITETWLDSSCTDSELSIPDDYVIFRRDRETVIDVRHGGGVLLCLKACLNPRRLENLDHHQLENISAEISINGSKWIVSALYRPPSNLSDFWDRLQDHIDQIQVSSLNHRGIILTGDFNIDVKDPDAPDTVRLLSMLEAADLSQEVKSVKRQSTRDPTIGSKIDHFYTNRPDLFDSINVQPNPVSSDHLAIYFRFRLLKPFVGKGTLREFLLYKKAEFDHFNQLLELAPWDLYFDPNDVDATWEGFLDLLLAASRDAIPDKLSGSKKTKAWITREIKGLIRKKHRLFTIAKCSNSSGDWMKFKEVRNKTKSMINSSYWLYVNHLFTLNDNRKRFFAYVRSRKTSLAPPVLVDNNNVINKPNDIAERFATYFQSIYPPPSNLPNVPDACVHPIPPLCSVEISTSDIAKAIMLLQDKKSPGPDSITPTMLKKSVKVISPILQRLFALFLRHQSLPSSSSSSSSSSSALSEISSYQGTAVCHSRQDCHVR